LDVKRGQLGADEREKLILNTAKADGHNVTIGVEQEPGSGGKESAEGTVKRLKGYTVITDRPVGDKIYRADPLSTQVNWGNVLLLVGEWVDRYVEEFKLFPLGKYKDQVDASGGAFAVLTGRLKKKARALGGKRSEQSAGKKRRFSKIRR